MAQNNRSFTFIRVDASGRDVTGSNQLRIKKPVTGRWRQLTAYECCNPVLTQLLTSTPADVTLTAVNFHLLCDDTTVVNLSVVATTLDIDEVVDALNDNFSTYGVFAADGADITLTLPQGIADALCPDGELSFVID